MLSLPIAATSLFECHILDTGYCLALEAVMVRGGRLKVVQCHSVVALLRHPQHGWMLWDAGYAPRLLDATGRWPFRLYRMATPLKIEGCPPLEAQLERFGLAPDDIKTVVLSHLHADHIAGVRDFPKAQFVLTREAFEDARARTGWKALKRAFVPQLLPDDFEERTTLLPNFEGPEAGPLGGTHDLWGDGSCVLVSLPGHARGQIGMIASTTRGRMFFVADGCWHRQSLRDGCAPHPLTNLVVDNPKEVVSTVRKLRQFAHDYPEVTMVPTHCPESFGDLVVS